MSPIVQGLDRAAAPPADAAKRMLDSIGGRWWNVYIGGPSSTASGWTPELVQAYAAHGIDRFMITYAGRQKRGPLTRAQGQADAVDALSRARAFGYSGDFPICLDIEHPTFESAPGPTVQYARGWCEGIRAHGARPGIYANPDAVRAMHGKVDADFVWVASWVSHAATHHDPHAALGVPAGLWSNDGQRAWQYAGERSLMGLNVDINVADLACLASAPGVASAAVIATPRRGGKVLARRGDSGPVVQRLTRRLSFVHSRRTGQPYLDGARARYDAETVAAVKAFQEEHGLKVNGVFGPRTARALRRSVEIRKAKARAKHPAADPKQQPVHHNGKARGAGQLVSLVNQLRKAEADTDQAWKALVAYGEKRRELLRRVRSETGHDVTLADLAAILERIEHEVETLVEMEQRELAQHAEPVATTEAVHTTTETAAPAVEPTPAPPAPAPVATTETVTAEVAAPVATAGGNGDAGPAPGTPHPAPPAPAAPPPRPPIDLSKLTDDELIRRVDRLDLGVDRSRDVLIARYAHVEKRLARLVHEHGRQGGNGSATPVAHPVQPVKPVPAPPGTRSLQKLLNAFAAKHLKGMAPLAVDGKIGPATKARIRAVKYYLGYADKNRKSVAVDAKLLQRLHRPGSARLSNPAMLARARARRRKQHKMAKRSAAPHAGVATFDGRPVAAWMAPYLHWARDNGWAGTLNSGWRDPAYSEHLCMQKCGKPKCPNTCAGRSSNHVGRVKPQGAIDVSHYAEFAELMRRCPLTPRILNDLPSDPVHFSATGH
jgi:glycoside hydrolase-like protein/putative peptidoglycan binding protein